MAKICLNMIVKNEEHIIEKLLSSVVQYISYYVILDTGSTDKTMEIIKNFGEKNNLQGEIHQDKWIDDFGYSRSHALELCKGKGDYVWIIDADNFLVGTIDVSNLICDSYSLHYKSTVSFYRTQIIKNDGVIEWKWFDVLHEYLAPKIPGTLFTTDKIKPGSSGSYYIQDYHLGSRTLDPLKYEKDIFVLEKAIINRPNYPRYVFYLANSYLSARKYEYAIINYRRRIELKGWEEEVYQSYFNIGISLKMLKKPLEEIEKAFLVCSDYSKHRAEPLYELSLLYVDKDFEEAYKWAKKASYLTLPQYGLFITHDVYLYQNKDNLALCAYYTRRYKEAFQLWSELLISPDFPENHKERIKNNLNFCIKEIISISEILI